MNLRLIRIMLAVPLVLLLAAGTTVIALREPVAVHVPEVHLAEAADTAPSSRSPAAAPTPVITLDARLAEPAEIPVSAPVEQHVDYHKLTSDLEQAASALERFNRKLMLALAPPGTEDDTAQDAAADSTTATEEESKP